MNKERFFIKAGKLFFAIYILYSYLIRYVLFSFPHLSQILLAFSLFAFIANRKAVIICKDVNIFMCFGLFSLGASFFAYDTSIAFTYSQLIIEYIIVIYLIIQYTLIDGSLRFPCKVFSGTGVAMAIYMLFFGVGINNRISISEGINVNMVGVILAFSICYLLFLLLESDFSSKRLMIVAVLIVFLLFSVVSTASKKSIISSGVFLIVFMLFGYRYVFKQVNPYIEIISTFLIIAICLVGYYIVITKYGDRLLYAQARMDDMITDDSTLIRYRLIQDGFSVFKRYPLFGVGINNYRFYSVYETYSHCSYSELLACTGSFGTILFAIPFIKNGHSLIQLYKQAENKTIEKARVIFFIFAFVTLLFVCSTQIIIYTPSLMYVMGTIMAFVLLRFQYNEIKAKEKK